MIKAMITPDMWEELDYVLRKHQIGYTVSFDAHGKDHREMLIAINPIGVQYYGEDNAYTTMATGVPKAKWEGVGYGYVCSNCRNECNGYESSNGSTIDFLDHFCPNCGAEMENWE